MALFERHGFLPGSVPILQPAEPFIELSGEDIRRRLFLVGEAGADELCLRPEFTIPAARAHLASSRVGEICGYAFLGPVFRQRAEGSGEFVQASVESFGRTDIEAADAAMLALAMEVEAALGGTDLIVRFGDLGLTSALIAALDLPAPVARRVRQKGLIAPAVAATGETTANGLSAYRGVLGALKNSDPAEARAFVKDLLSIAGLKAVGGRSAAEIAERFLEKASDTGAGLSDEHAAILDRFQAISGDPDSVAVALRTLSDEAGLGLGPAIDRFETRTGFMAARGIDLNRLQTSTTFARNLDYYSGCVFEFVAPGSDRPAIAGGRYDGLLKRLGAIEDVPAVGCSIWLERFGGEA